MKNRVLNAVIYIITGSLLAIGPHTFFQVCDKTEKVMKCWWSTRAEIAVGGLLIFSAMIILLSKRKEVVQTLNLYNVAIGIVAILVPKVLVGGCQKVTMPCRSLTFPAIYIISVFVILFSIGNMIYLGKMRKNL